MLERLVLRPSSMENLFKKSYTQGASDVFIGNPRLCVEIGMAGIHVGSHGLEVHSGPSLAKATDTSALMLTMAIRPLPITTIERCDATADFVGDYLTGGNDVLFMLMSLPLPGLAILPLSCPLNWPVEEVVK